MRKLFLMLITLSLLLTLTACGEVKATEEAIAAIGTVTIDSLDVLKQADAMYEALGDKQEKVENYQDLVKAWDAYNNLLQIISEAEIALEAISPITPESGEVLEAAWDAYFALEEHGLVSKVPGMSGELRDADAEYNRQCALITDYEEAIAAIGTVTLESHSAIDHAQDAYDVLIREHLTDYTSNIELISAKKTFDDLTIEAAYQQIIQLYDSGKYQDAIDGIDLMAEAHPKHKYTVETNLLKAECYIALAAAAYEANELEAALQHLDSAAIHGSSMDSYQSVLEKVQKAIAKLRPSNGKVLVKKLGSAYGKLTVVAGSTDVCVKVESIDDPTKFIQFYVHADNKATVSIPNGKYTFKYTFGETWFGPEHYFGSESFFSQSDDTLEFTTSRSGSYIYYSTITITLHTVFGGNFGTHSIQPDSF